MIREEQDISDLSDNTFRMGGQWIPDGGTIHSEWGDNGFRMGRPYINTIKTQKYHQYPGY